MTTDHRRLVYELEHPLRVLAKLGVRKNGSLALPSTPKMGPRAEFLLHTTILALVGLYIGLPSFCTATIELRAQEDPDTVRTSLKEKFEEWTLLPFLHTGVYVPGDAGLRPHIHLLFLSRQYSLLRHHPHVPREWRAMSGFRVERNRRSGLPTSVHFDNVDDLVGLIRMRPRFDPIIRRPVGRAGYLSGNRNLTRAGSKRWASNIIRALRNDFVASGPNEITDIVRHLRKIMWRWSSWKSRSSSPSLAPSTPGSSPTP